MIECLTNGQCEGLQQCALIIFIFWLIMVVAVLIDLWTGVEKAKARHERVYSDRLRRTVVKIGEYWRVQLMFLLFDVTGSFITAYNLPYASMLGTVCIVFIELRSVFENLREKKSSAADIPQALKDIINCRDIDKARELIETFKTERHDYQ